MEQLSEMLVDRLWQLCHQRGLLLQSEEVEVLAYRQVMEFALDARFSDLIVEGDNSNVMRSIVSA